MDNLKISEKRCYEQHAILRFLGSVTGQKDGIRCCGSTVGLKESIQASRHGLYEWDDSPTSLAFNLGVAEDFLDKLKGPVEEVPRNGPVSGKCRS